MLATLLLGLGALVLQAHAHGYVRYVRLPSTCAR